MAGCGRERDIHMKDSREMGRGKNGTTAMDLGWDLDRWKRNGSVAEQKSVKRQQGEHAKK